MGLSKSFLVVDDSAMMRQLVVMTLRKMGCASIIEAEQSPDANEIAHEMDQIRAVLLHSANMASGLQELSETLARQSEALRRVSARFQTEAFEELHSR
jgi:CheY-like chemotaxis protein